LLFWAEELETLKKKIRDQEPVMSGYEPLNPNMTHACRSRSALQLLSQGRQRKWPTGCCLTRTNWQWLLRSKFAMFAFTLESRHHLAG
jgi:hypothetical protein